MGHNVHELYFHFVADTFSRLRQAVSVSCPQQYDVITAIPRFNYPIWSRLDFINRRNEIVSGQVLMKMISVMFSGVLLLPWCLGQAVMPNLSNVTTAFSSAQIVPDVLPSFSPTDGVNLTFTDPVSMQSVDVVPGLLLTMGRMSIPANLVACQPQF